MTRFSRIILLACTLSLSSCDKCVEENHYGNPERYFRLYSFENNDLWFGASAIYSPDSARFEDLNGNRIPTRVDREARAVAITLPPASDPKNLRFRPSPNDTDQIRYRTFELKEECESGLVLDYLDFNGSRRCTICGDGRFNPSRFIVLKKNL